MTIDEALSKLERIEACLLEAEREIARLTEENTALRAEIAALKARGGGS